MNNLDRVFASLYLSESPQENIKKFENLENCIKENSIINKFWTGSSNNECLKNVSPTIQNDLIVLIQKLPEWNGCPMFAHHSGYITLKLPERIPQNIKDIVTAAQTRSLSVKELSTCLSYLEARNRLFLWQNFRCETQEELMDLDKLSTEQMIEKSREFPSWCEKNKEKLASVKGISFENCAFNFITDEFKYLINLKWIKVPSQLLHSLEKFDLPKDSQVTEIKADYGRCLLFDE